MIRAYNELYLSDAKKFLAETFDYAINICRQDADWFAKLFVSSGLAEQFEIGNPSVISGKAAEVARAAGIRGDSGNKGHHNSLEAKMDRTGLSFVFLKDAIKKENIEEIALGYPLHMSGEVSPRAESSKRFKEDLEKDNPNLKIALVDERLTTVIAHKRLMEADLSRNKRKEVIDMMSAVVILETYLQTRKGY